MASDTEIERAVADALRRAPDLDPTDIALAVKDGVVTLAGFVPSYMQKFAAEEVAKRHPDVVGVANDLEVRLPGADERPDPDIARDAVSALKTRVPFDADGVKVVVKSGWITLEGEVDWNYQRDSVESAVRWVRGVRGIRNLIRLKPHQPPGDAKRAEEAVRRMGQPGPERVTAAADGAEVVLKEAAPSAGEPSAPPGQRRE
jgi:osmotically-inducible protein OsmY